MRLPRWLFIPFILIGILYWTQDIWQSKNEPSVFDLPKTLEEERFDFVVYPVSRAQGVLVFSTSPGANEDDYLYLVPDDVDVDIPPRYEVLRDSGYQLKVFGRFYYGKGIPAEYLHAQPKPQRLRVFRFDSVALVPPQPGIPM